MLGEARGVGMLGRKQSSDRAVDAIQKESGYFRLEEASDGGTFDF